MHLGIVFRSTCSGVWWLIVCSRGDHSTVPLFVGVVWLFETVYTAPSYTPSNHFPGFCALCGCTLLVCCVVARTWIFCSTCYVVQKLTLSFRVYERSGAL
jgi:hypothetical protein